MPPASPVSSPEYHRSHGSSLRELGAPLDQERAASMADEGGVSGAITDAAAQARAQTPPSDASLDRPVYRRSRTRFTKVLPWALAAAGAALALVLWRRR